MCRNGWVLWFLMPLYFIHVSLYMFIQFLVFDMAIQHFLVLISYIDLISFVKVLHSPSNLELRHTVPHSQKKSHYIFFFVFFVLLQTSTKLTAAQKSLSKVDKKGMKSISSFFGAAVGSKKTKKRQCWCTRKCYNLDGFVQN